MVLNPSNSSNLEQLALLKGLIIFFAIIWTYPGNEPYLFDERRIGSSMNEPSVYIAMVCQLY